MKSKVFVLVLFYLAIGWALDAKNDSSATLVVHISGFESDDGLALIALSNTQENFDAHTAPFRSASVKIEQKRAACQFKNLQKGVYAIKVFHDENNDGKLDTNFLGMPTEDYGFSNNARGSFGPASWEDACFKYELDSMTIEIQVK